MNWGSAAEFFAMGGHGYFVWMSYAAALILMVAEPLLGLARHRNALREAGRRSSEDHEVDQ